MGNPRAHLGDVIAGLSVAVVVIPQSLAYADLAGMPPIAGLYASALPPIAAALFASSPYLQTGPVAITALLTFGALNTLATPGSPEYVTLGFALALVVGLVRIALGLLRAGWVSYLMSQPMLLGFTPAAAILIAASQLPQGLGVRESPDYDNQLAKALWSLGHPGLWSGAAVLVLLATVAVILLARRVHPLIPGVLICAAVATTVSAAGGYDGRTIGEVPSGFLPFTVDDLPWDQLPKLVVSGALIALIGFTEAASISRRFAAEDRSRWNPDREFISQGAANVVAACSGGMPCGGSFSRSAIARQSGARTRLSGAVTGIAVLIFLPFVAIVEPMPLAALSGIVIAAVLSLMKFRPLIRLWKLSVPQAVIAWSTFVMTLAVAPHLDWAVGFGVGLSLLIFLWRGLQLEVDVRADEEVLYLSPRGILWFGTAQRLDEAVLDAVTAHPTMRSLQIDLTGLGRIDTTGALVLSSVLERAEELGLTTTVIGVPKQSQALTERILRAGYRRLS
ncbi:MAG: SulP family inorganic anion transporter [Sporichthyaceae bacterium]